MRWRLMRSEGESETAVLWGVVKAKGTVTVGMFVGGWLIGWSVLVCV